MNLLLASTILCVSLAGCASKPPTAEELANADYGAPIQQEEAQTLAAAWVQGTLDHSTSAEYDWGSVRTGWEQDGGERIFGYLLEARINVRKSSGGYTGYRRYVFLFRDGSLGWVWGEESMMGTSYSSHMKRLK